MSTKRLKRKESRVPERDMWKKIQGFKPNKNKKEAAQDDSKVTV
jgi:hypothetical protein